MLPTFWYFFWWLRHCENAYQILAPLQSSNAGKNAVNILMFVFMAWAFHGTRKSSQTHIKIHSQSTKNHQKSVTWDGCRHPWAHPGAFLGTTTWAWILKTIKKVTWWTLPGGAKGIYFSTFSDTFRVLFSIQVFVSFLLDLGNEMTPESEVGCVENIMNTRFVVRFHFFTCVWNNYGQWPQKRLHFSTICGLN
jgi:hypothetical protein